MANPEMLVAQLAEEPNEPCCSEAEAPLASHGGMLRAELPPSASQAESATLPVFAPPTIRLRRGGPSDGRGEPDAAAEAIPCPRRLRRSREAIVDDDGNNEADERTHCLAEFDLLQAEQRTAAAALALIEEHEQSDNRVTRPPAPRRLDGRSPADDGGDALE